MVKPITQYPIVMDVQEGSLTEHKKLENGAAVHCLRCGKKFLVNEDTAYLAGKYDIPVLICPKEECGYKASVLYYFPKKGGHQFVRERIITN